MAYVRGCLGELKEKELCPYGGYDMQKGQCVQQERREEIKKEFNRSRTIKVEKKHKAIYSSWKYRGTMGFPTMR